jgi:hypothetical protein
MMKQLPLCGTCEQQQICSIMHGGPTSGDVARNGAVAAADESGLESDWHSWPWRHWTEAAVAQQANNNKGTA